MHRLLTIPSVSYTHLDVYKRQVLGVSRRDRLKNDGIRNVLGIFYLNERISNTNRIGQTMVKECIRPGYQNKLWFIFQKDGGILGDQRRDGWTKECVTDRKIYI